MTKKQRLEKLQIDIYNCKSIIREMLEEYEVKLEEMLELIQHLRKLEAEYKRIKNS